MAQKKLCILCPFFKPQPWCIGWCEHKKQYIHTALKYCSVGTNTEYALSGDDWLLNYWHTAIGWAQKRYDLLEEFYASRDTHVKRTEVES